VPDFETGYYLASYKCICKANHEFPFADYGSGYYEGATVEKEYEKKIRGQPNVYDKLKCRPVSASKAKTARSSFYSTPYSSTATASSHLSSLVLLSATATVLFIITCI
jgi:hypothetical protein